MPAACCLSVAHVSVSSNHPDRMKDAVIAKLANQAADFYGDAFKQCHCKDSVPKVWTHNRRYTLSWNKRQQTHTHTQSALCGCVCPVLVLYSVEYVLSLWDHVRTCTDIFINIKHKFDACARGKLFFSALQTKDFKTFSFLCICIDMKNRTSATCGDVLGKFVHDYWHLVFFRDA